MSIELTDFVRACKLPGSEVEVHSAKVYSDFLVPEERIARLPLPEWVLQIQNRLNSECTERGDNDDFAWSCKLKCFNEAALVEAYLGRLDRASYLCKAAIDWVARNLDRSDQLTLGRFAIQPYVNLGRIDRMEGRWGAALDKFAAVGSAANKEPLTIGPVRLTGAQWNEVALRDPEWLRSLENIYVVDSFKTLFRANRFEAVLQFITEGRFNKVANTDDFLLEASIIALCKLGSLHLAIELIEKRLRSGERSNRAVFGFRCAEALWLAGERIGASRLSERLTAAFVDPSLKLSPPMLNLLSKLASWLIGSDPGKATACARVGFSASKRMNDVVYQKEFASVLLLASEDPAEKKDAGFFLEQLRRCTWYGIFADGQLVESATGDLMMVDKLFEQIVRS